MQDAVRKGDVVLMDPARCQKTTRAKERVGVWSTLKGGREDEKEDIEEKRQEFVNEDKHRG